MPEPITPRQLAILAYIKKNPNVAREQLVAMKATDEDIKYMELHDMIREREPGHYHVAHFGDRVLGRTR